MMDALYREIILDHVKSPRRRGPLDGATASGRAHNPVCGDRVRVEIRRDGDALVVGFTGNGCAISQASASVMAEGVDGRTVDEARALIRSVEAMMHGADPPEGLDDLAAFVGVRQFPGRVRCALLAWNALGEAIDQLP